MNSCDTTTSFYNQDKQDNVKTLAAQRIPQELANSFYSDTAGVTTNAQNEFISSVYIDQDIYVSLHELRFLNITNHAFKNKPSGWARIKQPLNRNELYLIESIYSERAHISEELSHQIQCKFKNKCATTTCTYMQKNAIKYSALCFNSEFDSWRSMDVVDTETDGAYLNKNIDIVDDRVGGENIPDD